MEGEHLNPKTIEVEKSVLTLRRVIIEGVKPEVEGGRFPIKRVVGERVTVEADIFADGHSMLSAVVCYRPARARAWHESAMQLVENDRWRGQFRVETLEPFVYTFQAWVDEFQTWNRDFIKKFEAGQDISLDLLAGAKLIDAAASRASHADSQTLRQFANDLKNNSGNGHSFPVERIRDAELARLMQKYPDRRAATTYERELRVVVNREKAGFSSWYEMFPRSCTSDASKHGTFRDCIPRLDYVAGMGFDVLYLPPIHPIGHIGRKGKNNTLQPLPGDPGSPWAIGSSEGGHKAIHPQLGTLDDLKLLVAAAKDRGIEIALDIAFQAAPDHPYVKEHDEWFRHRPDGSIQYAENPPKKYEDIFPLYFENEHAQELCEELKSVVTYWMDQGIRIFRVDNPHTKPFAFWEWLIGEVNRDHPDVIFLAEAFTRPKVMYRLAKLGFTQSYTYFAWKNTKFELTQYFTELTQTGLNEFFRPNLWPNTPDILNDYLQHGGRPAFMARLILAGTLGANYGIYGPAFELCESQPLKLGSEEYLNSEKYEIRLWDLDRPDSLSPLIRRVNKIRREHVALQKDWSLRFLPVDNDQIIAYSKTAEDSTDTIVTIVNLDPHFTQSGWVQLPLREMGLPANQPYEVEDLLTDARYQWQGDRNYVALDPSRMPAHILKIR
jgi:starch synthase (maltosyl-transferring)